MTTPKSPFERLVEHYGPNGKGSQEPCRCSLDAKLEGLSVVKHRLCGGTGYVLDPDNPFTKALWRPCGGLEEGLCKDGILQADDLPFGRLGNPHKFCGGTGYVRRSRAEATLPLLDAARLEYGVTITMYKFGECRAELHGGLGAGGVDDNPLDAVSAAILEKEGVKTDA